MADDLLHKITHQIATASANPATRFQQPFANLGQQLVARNTPAQKQQIQRKARALLASPAKVKSFGRFHAVAPAIYQQSALPATLRVGRSSISGRSTLPVRPISPSKIGRTGAVRTPSLTRKPTLQKLDPGPRYSRIELFLRDLKVNEETDEIGNDDILMGTSCYMPNGARVAGAEWKVGEFSHTRSDRMAKRSFVTSSAPYGRKLGTLGLGDVEGANWPHAYSWLVVLMEQDDGGFAALLRKLWDSIGAEVTKYLKDAAYAGIGALIGSAFPGLGTLVGAVVGWLVGKVAEFLIQLFDNPDDYIDTVSIDITLANNWHSYFAQSVWKGPRSEPFRRSFAGDGGRYVGTFQLVVS